VGLGLRTLSACHMVLPTGGHWSLLQARLGTAVALAGRQWRTLRGASWLLKQYQSVSARTCCMPCLQLLLLQGMGAGWQVGSASTLGVQPAAGL
jgi:hypothetical protein